MILLFSCFNFIGIIPVSILYGPEHVLAGEDEFAILLHLIDVRHLMANQTLIVYVGRVKVDRIPVACPTLEAAQLHVPFDWPEPRLDLYHYS
mgnify:FL=1